MRLHPKNTDGTLMTMKDYFSRARNRKAKRTAKGIALGLRHLQPCKQRTRPISQVSTKGAVKASIVRLLGLLDKKLNGPYCRMAHLCPAYRDIGNHAGQVGYHLIPQQRGDAARFIPENVIWACSRANFGEMNNRDLYRHFHVTLFGKERIERIEEISRTTVHYTMADLREAKARLVARLESL